MGAIEELLPQSVASGVAKSGDLSPDEVNDTMDTIVDIGVECEAFVALRDLATLVARRRGMNVEGFVSQLMRLFSPRNDNERDMMEVGWGINELDGELQTPGGLLSNTGPESSQRRLRRFRSEPQLAADKNRRRHFSFEPGDDRLGVLNDQLTEFERNRPKSPAGSQSTKSSEDQHELLERMSGCSLSRSQTLSADAPKPSKIPSPLHQPTLGRPRRENSSSSLRTVSGRDRYRLDDRRDSRSSVLTAFRQNSSGSLRRPESASRSSSITNFRQTDMELRESSGSNRFRNNAVALAAARAASNNSASEPKPSEPEKDDRSSSAPYSPIQLHSTAGKSTFPPFSENDCPPKRG
jgi:hypothetical protein